VSALRASLPAAVLAAGLLAAAALAQPAPTTTATQAEAPLKIGIIGAGHIGGTLA
jgi:hypothetical protein